MVPEPDVGGAEEAAFDAHRVDDLGAWRKDCDAIDRVRKAEGIGRARMNCVMTGDVDGDGKPDTIELRVSKDGGSSGLAVSWGDGSFSMLGGGRRVLLTGAPLPTDPDDDVSDEVFDSMDWVADARVLPLQDGKVRYPMGPATVTVGGIASISGDALYISGDDAAGLVFFDAAGDRWRFIHLGL